MLRYTKILFAALVATIAMAFAASAANAATGILRGPTTTTATSTNLTLTVSSLATVTGTTRLGVLLIPGTYTATTASARQVGGILTADITVGSPANTTVTPSNLPWLIFWRGELVATNAPRLYANGILLIVRSGVLVKTCTGSFAFSVNAAGTIDTIDSSVTLTCTGSSTATLAGTLSNSPAISFTLV